MSNNQKMYSIDTIMEILEQQFMEIMRDDYEFYKDYDIELANEQKYVKSEDRKTPNKIYIVVRFLPAEINHNQNVIPFTITAVSEYNKIKACQKLLLEYAQTFNLKDDSTDDGIVYNQTYTTPQVMSNFSEVYYGYRDTLFMSGSFLLSYNINPSSFSYIYVNEKGDETEDEIETITFAESVDFQLDTQPFYGSNNFTKSETKLVTRTINFSLYLVNDDLCNKILDIVNGLEDPGYEFMFKIEYKNGRSLIKPFKIANYSRNQDIGAMPIINVTFTN